MNDDALDRLRKRQRPSVPERDLDVIEGEHLAPASNPQLASSQPSTPDTQTNRYRDLETKASTLRLEAEIAKELSLLCKREEISREVLVEAMFIYCQGAPEAMSAVLESARRRNQERVELSNRRRAETMMRRFGSGSSS